MIAAEARRIVAPLAGRVVATWPSRWEWLRLATMLPFCWGCGDWVGKEGDDLACGCAVLAGRGWQAAGDRAEGEA